FLIGTTDFGVQADSSRFEIVKRDGRLLLTLEINCSNSICKQLSKEEKWDWILYPPMFYVRRYPVTEMPGDHGMIVKFSASDYDRHDIALYLDSHNDVNNVTIKIQKDRIEVVGNVTIDGADIHDERLQIRWMK
ncbi:MAG TPA: hypothetical protein VFE62_05275, partial [Gemmataceae bacterium]|nr:hypothetical protein [Gemmataceae bacterium]